MKEDIRKIAEKYHNKECFILCNEGTVAVSGKSNEVLSMFSCIVESLYKEFSKERLQLAFEIALADEKELLTKLSDLLKEMKDNL